MNAEEVHLYEGAQFTLHELRHLLDDLGTPIDRKDPHGRTLLMSATVLSDENLVEEIIKRGANVNIGDRNGWTALHKACFLGRTSVAKLLLENGANVNARDRYKHTPIQFACDKSEDKASELLPLLVKCGADLNLTNSNGCGPIEHAVLDKNLYVIQALTQAGANFPANFEYLFASLPYTQMPKKNTMINLRAFLAVRCISYLVNSKWDEVKDKFPQDRCSKDNVSYAVSRKRRKKQIAKGYQHPKALQQGFDFKSANEKSLEADPRVQWIRKACLNERIPYDPQDQVTVANTLKSLLIPKLKFYPTPKRSHPIPLHRALSCKTSWCSWVGHEGYIQALVKVNPRALEEQDPLTGLFAFQIAALRTGDLDSVYNLLRMAPNLVPLQHMKIKSSSGTTKVFGLKIRPGQNNIFVRTRGNRLLQLLFFTSTTVYLIRYHFHETLFLFLMYILFFALIIVNK
jgi:hypothetical protein